MLEMKPILCLVGPTCSGKSAASMQIAAQGIDGKLVEIISMDSALVYLGMDIGTAKPTREERAQVPHHLIDIIEPTQAYSAAQFVKDATRLVHDIRARGHEPLIVGGTMLYLKALRDGLDDMPASEPAIRAEIDAEAAAQGWPAMHAQLAQIDPLTAARLSMNDQQRIQRALEVYRATGKPLSSFQKGLSFPRKRESSSALIDTPTHDQEAVDSRLRGNDETEGIALRILAMPSNDRAELHARIAARFHAMLKQGFLDEVRTLMQRGDLHPELPSMRCVGYRQAWEHLEGKTTYDEFVEKGIAATRQLAKRQLTWLRGMNHINYYGILSTSK